MGGSRTGRAVQPRHRAWSDGHGAELPRGLPEPDLRHLYAMTDDVGMLQHATFAIPDRRHGYCTDDNARALVAALMYWKLREDQQVWSLIPTYLAFLTHAFNDRLGRFRNFMSFSRRWLEEVGSEDSHARAMMALGVAASIVPDEATLGLCVRLFGVGLPAAEGLTAWRSQGLLIIGCDAYLRRFPEREGVQEKIELLAGRLMQAFRQNASGEWPWLEDALTWGNARVPHGLLLAGSRLGSDEMTDTGVRCLRWLLRVQTDKTGCLSLVGNRGWYPRGGTPARFDQQPIEVMALAEACRAAFRLTGDRAWLVEIGRCIEWFLGRNVQGIPLYDPTTGGGRDGLGADGVNPNQGAESTLAWLTTLLLAHDLQADESLQFPFPSTRSLESEDGGSGDGSRRVS